MYRALYSFSAEGNQYLNVQQDDRFTALALKGEWIWAQNGLGEIGYIPTSYVVKENVTYLDVLKSIDRAIEVIHFEASKKGNYTHQQRDNLQKLVQHREYVIAEEKKKQGTSSECEATSKTQPREDSSRQSVKRAAPPPPSMGSNLVQSNTVSTTVNPEQPLVGQQTVTTNNSSEDYSQPTKDSKRIADVDSRIGKDKSLSKTENDSNSTTLHNSKTENTHKELQDSHIKTDVHPFSENLSATSFTNKKHGGEKTQEITDCSQDIYPCHSTSTSSEIKLNVCAEDLNNADSRKKIDIEQLLLPSSLGPQLIEEVRKGTDLNYEKSKMAVDIVLGYIGYTVPSLTLLMDKILSSLQDVGSPELENSHDAQRLRSIFTELTACKDDSQQRSWALHEDESIISSNLQDLLSILDNAKPSICKRVVAEENYECIHHIVQYYQMETRLKLRLLLLQIFGALCSLDKTTISLLLYSVLPLELVRELKAHCDDVQRLNYVSLVLTMVFSMGEPLPLNLHDLNLRIIRKRTESFQQKKFSKCSILDLSQLSLGSNTLTDKICIEELISVGYLHFVLELIENPPTVRHEQQCTDQLVNLLLAYNLHLKVIDTNQLIKALADNGTAKVFTEKLMLIFNRGDDPVDMFPHKPRPGNSVMKFFQDLYSCEATSNLLYTNDAQVLIGIILRHLADSSPGEQIRTDHLYLLKLLMKNSEYAEHRHRLNDLKSSLIKIVNEEENIVTDKQIAQQILDDNKSLFS